MAIRKLIYNINFDYIVNLGIPAGTAGNSMTFGQKGALHSGKASKGIRAEYASPSAAGRHLKSKYKVLQRIVKVLETS